MSQMTWGYACPAHIGNGHRCGNPASNNNEFGLCAECEKKEGVERAPKPDFVLVKVGINPGLASELRKFLPQKKRDVEKAMDLEAAHLTDAESIGRNPYAGRDQKYADNPRPQDADSGSCVFGRSTPMRMVSLAGLKKELENADLRFTGAHILERGKKCTLVMEYKNEGEAREMHPKLEEFLNAAYQEIFIWANGMNHMGFVNHTVNCSGRMDQGKPVVNLLFADGLWSWKLEEVAEPVGDTVTD